MSSRLPLLCSCVALAWLALCLGGCFLIRVAGKTATTTIGVATDVTAAAVRGTGRVAAAAVGASGDVADESVRVAGRLSKSGIVVFFDPQTGLTWETPWREGLKLVAASEIAQVDAALQAVRVIRAGKPIPAKQAGSFIVQSGDVVELTRKVD